MGSLFSTLPCSWTAGPGPAVRITRENLKRGLASNAGKRRGDVRTVEILWNP